MAGKIRWNKPGLAETTSIWEVLSALSGVFCDVAVFYKKCCAVLGLPSALALPPDVVVMSQRAECWGGHVTGGWWHATQDAHRNGCANGDEQAGEPGLR